MFAAPACRMEIELVAIKLLAAFLIAAVVLASSALAAVEWCDSPVSPQLSSCEPGRTKEALVVVAPRPARLPGSSVQGFGARPPHVVVLTQHQCLSKD